MLRVGVFVLLVILIPYFLLEEKIAQGVERMLVDPSPGGKLFLIFAALLALDAVLPVPSSVISVSAGALLGFWSGACSVWIGMTVGCAIGYLGGVFMGPMVFRRHQQATSLAAPHLRTRVALTVVLTRAVPVLAESVTLTAGILRVPFPPFMIASAAANLVIAIIYAYAGSQARNWSSVLVAFSVAVLLPILARQILYGYRKAPLPADGSLETSEPSESGFASKSDAQSGSETRAMQ